MQWYNGVFCAILHNTGLLTQCMLFINQIIEKGMYSTLGTTSNGYDIMLYGCVDRWSPYTWICIKNSLHKVICYCTGNLTSYDRCESRFVVNFTAHLYSAVGTTRFCRPTPEVSIIRVPSTKSQSDFSNRDLFSEIIINEHVCDHVCVNGKIKKLTLVYQPTTTRSHSATC